jgi:hypothetical protein
MGAGISVMQQSTAGSQGAGQTGSHTVAQGAGQTGSGSQHTGSDFLHMERFSSHPPDAGVTVVVTIMEPTIEK